MIDTNLLPHAIIELRDCTKTFSDILALGSVSLRVPSAKTTVLIGPSGCGKSTLLRLIIGLIRPNAGQVLFDGRDIVPERVLSMRKKMGYVIQEGGLFPHLSAAGNITLMARHLKWDMVRIESRLRELADLVRFPVDGLTRFPAQLSGGQRQRVSLMRALMLDPDVLLLDEPLAALDPIIRTDLQADLKRIFQALNKTVILVTHDMGEAAFFGDLIVLLKDGRVVQEGGIEEFFQNPSDPFVSRFINAQRSPLNGAGRDVA
ncbi:MAG: ATP-binding cassette domain-containing protein [Syntrophorhabdales bacterium]